MFERKPRSERESELLDAAARCLPGGVRNATMSPERAMVVESASGSHIRDASGNEYIDYLLGSGPMVLGHAHPAVVEAVRQQLARGSTYLMVNEPAIRLAEKIVEAVPCAESVAFHSSGSESVFFALRVARAATGRTKILKFEGAFHGMSDYALMSNQWTREMAEPPRAVANSAGIPAAIAAEVLVAPYNDLAATERIIAEHRDDLAAVIVEPMQRTLVPEAGFLEGLREITRREGVVLVFDEMVTAFRLAYGGAQEYYGVVPDLCAMGKSLSGGHPISVLCGRADLMSVVSPAAAASGSFVAQSGTFSGNPISTAAGLAALSVLGEDGVYERLFAKGRRLMDAFGEALANAGIGAQLSGEPPAFEVWFTETPLRDFRATQTADAAMHMRLTDLLLDRGIVKAHEKFFVSTAHTDDDISRTIKAFSDAVAVLAEEIG